MATMTDTAGVRSVSTAAIAANTPTTTAARPWPFVEDKMTEPEGRMLEAFRLWTEAQTNPELHARLEALEMLRDGIQHANEGCAEAFVQFYSLSPADAELLKAAATLFEHLVASVR